MCSPSDNVLKRTLGVHASCQVVPFFWGLVQTWLPPLVCAVWNQVYGFDMSCIRKQAMLEPLVDTVDANQIVTHSTLLKTMDIEKMTAGDASFSAPFKLVASRNDFIHALVAYFDVTFSKCHKATGFSTGDMSYISSKGGETWQQEMIKFWYFLSIF
jgi:hypothetical protein